MGSPGSLTTKPPQAEAVAVDLATLAVVGALAAGTVARGGFDGVVRPVMVAMVALAVLTVAARRAHDHRQIAVAGVLLAVGAVPSAQRNGVDGDLIAHASMALVVAGAAWVVANTTPNQRLLALRTVLLVGVATAVTGWIGVVGRLEPWAQVDPEFWRAAGSVTYANAAATLAGIGWLLAVGDRRLGPPLALDLLGAVCFVGAAASLSRSGIAGVALGVVAAVAVGRSGWVRDALPSIAGGLVGFGALVPGMAATGDSEPFLATGGLISAAAVTILVAHIRPGLTTAGVMLGGVVAIVLSVVTIGGAVAGRSEQLSAGRAAAWEAAWREFMESRWLGRGPGDLSLAWTGGEGSTSIAFVQNEYLEMLAEVGVVGLAVVLVGLAVLVTPALGGPDRGRIACVASVVVSVAFQSFFDFLWHIPIVPLAVGVVIGAGVQARDRQAEVAAVTQLA